ncbi:MAG: flagellar assembly protein FliW [Armatimonadetes bacterium]|nr:flagellar assembly protein FliW [Armatimonadota bacterium]
MMTQQAFATSRFGEIKFTKEDVVNFANGLLGFPKAQQFVLIQHKEGSPFRWLQSVESEELAFLVVDPAEYVTNYAPDMPNSMAQSLNLSEETPRLVYTIVTIPRGKPKDMTLNLAGPIVINAESGQAMQTVLENDEYEIRFRVFPKESPDHQAA